MNVLHSAPLLFFENASLFFVLGLHLLSVALNLVLVHLIDLEFDELHLTFLSFLGKLQLLLFPLDFSIVLITKGLLIVLELSLTLLFKLFLFLLDLILKLAFVVSDLSFKVSLQLFLVDLELLLNI